MRAVFFDWVPKFTFELAYSMRVSIRHPSSASNTWLIAGWGSEFRDVVDAEQHGFTVDHELLDPVLQGRLDNPRISVGPVVAVPGDQAHVVAVALQP